MAGGHGVEPELGGAFGQAGELDLAVALDARVRRRTGAMRRHVRRDDVGVEVVAEVEHEVFDAEGVGGAAGVVDIGHAAAARVALAAPQAHRHPDDVVTVGGEEGGGDGRVHAAAHRHHHLHRRPAACAAGRAAGAQRRDRRGEDLDGAVGVGLCRRPAERHPQGARRPRSLDAHGGEHVRRLHRPAGARRGRRRAEARLVEEEQQRLALHAFDADVGAAGDLDVGGDGLADTVDGGDQTADEPIAHGGDAHAFGLPLGVGGGEGGGHRHDPRHVVRPAPPVALLAAADEQRVDGDALADDEHADALRPAELVGAQRQQVDVRPELAEVEPARRLHGIGVQQARSAQRARTTPATAPRSLIEPTSLFTAITETIDTSSSIAAASCSRSARPYRSTPTTRPSWRSTTLSTPWCSVAGHTRHAAVAPDRSGDRRVVALGPAAREHDLARQAPDDLGDPVPGVVDGPAGLAGEAMGAARVGVAVGEERQHRVDGDLTHRRRRRMVEVHELLGHPRKATAARAVSRWWDSRPRRPP